MTSHIVISREELHDQLHMAFDAGWSKGNPSPSVETLVEKLDTRFVDWVNSRTVRVAHTLPSGWRPIAEAPRDGTWVLVAGPSGYTTTPWRVEVCRHDPEYRPRNPWQNHANNAFTDGGEQPTHFLPLVEPTEK